MLSHVKIYLLFEVCVNFPLILTLSDNHHCYSTSEHPKQENHYTLYAPHLPFFDSIPEIEGCAPERLWFVSRHGTRYPNEKKIRSIKKKLPTINKKINKTKQLCHQDYELLTQWEMNDTWVPCDLAPQGWTDLQQLAKSFKQIFPTLFSEPYSPKTYTFAHSSAERTKQSCESFVETLFNRKTMKESQKHWISNDTLLRPWSICEEFDAQALLLEIFETEMNKFQNSHHMINLKQAVSSRLGMNTLRYGMINLMWDECRFQHAYHLDRKSPWCAAFNLEEAIILEYLSDLDLYYRYSYGSEISPKLPCTVIKSMIDTMLLENSPNKVTAFFAHAELLLLIITALGAKYDRSPLLASNFEQQRNREFQSSKLVPYASTFSAVKFICSAESGTSSSGRLDTKILLLLNQKPIKMPWCAGGYICTIAEMTNMFDRSVMRNCPNDICGERFAKSNGLGLKVDRCTFSTT